MLGKAFPNGLEANAEHISPPEPGNDERLLRECFAQTKTKKHVRSGVCAVLGGESGYCAKGEDFIGASQERNMWDWGREQPFVGERKTGPRADARRLQLFDRLIKDAESE